MSRQEDINTLAAIAVFEHVQAGKRLTMDLVWSVIAKLESNAWGPAVYRQVEEWLAGVEDTRRRALR